MVWLANIITIVFVGLAIVVLIGIVVDQIKLYVNRKKYKGGSK